MFCNASGVLGAILFVSACSGVAPAVAPAMAAQESTPAPRAKLPGLIIIQESNGLPGQDLQKMAAQQILVTPDRLKLFDLETGLKYLFRLDREPHEFWEIAPDEKEYRSGTQFDSTQRDRDLAEQQILKHGKEMAKSAEAFAAELKAMHIQPDGRRDVTVEVTDGAEPLLKYPVKRYVVKENGRVIVDARVTEALGVSIPFFEFYRRVGAFSADVLAKLKEIPGVPLEATITVVTATLNYDIHAQVKEVAAQELDALLFEIPKGAHEVKESPYAACPSCGAQVSKAAPGFKVKTADGEMLFFCDNPRCKTEYRSERERILKENERRAKEKSGSTGGER